RERIAIAMGAADWLGFMEELDQHRARLSGHFRHVVFGNADADRSSVKIDLGRFWDTQAETAALVDSLSRAGFADADEASRLLLELRSSALVRKLDEPGRRRLQGLLPALLANIATSSSQMVVLRRILRIIEAIGQRSTYFALLQESPVARTRLVELCGHGEFLA